MPPSELTAPATLKVVGDSGRGHEPRPLGSVATWRLGVWVAGRRVLELSLAELLRLERRPYATSTGIICVSSGGIVRGAERVSFGGVRFRTLFDSLGVGDALGAVGELAPTVRFVSRAPGGCGPKSERHWTALPLADCLEPANGVMLATTLDGLPLPYENGGPLRSVVGPNLFFYKSIKWLAEIHLCRGPLGRFRGTWEEYAGYHNRARTALDERFEPRMREAVAVRVDGEERPAGTSRLVPRGAWRRTFERMLAARDLSRLIAARLNKMPQLALPSDFSGVRFAAGGFKAEIRGTSFRSCDLTGADLAGGNFSLCLFPNARFSAPGRPPARLVGCDFEGANFQHAWLQDVSMAGAYLANVRFTGDSFAETTDRVRGLDVRGAVDLDPRTRDWLDRNGARV